MLKTTGTLTGRGRPRPRRRLRAMLGSAAAMLFVAGCGGGDSGGGATPTPTPVPSAAPTPSPSPTPTPSASYASITDFSKDLFGQSPVAEVTYTEVYDVTSVAPGPYYKYKAASSRLLDSPGAGIFTWDPKEKVGSARVDGYFQTFPGTVEERPPSWSYMESVHNVDGDMRVLRWVGIKGSAFATIDLEVRPPCTYPPGEPVTCTGIRRYAQVGGQTLPGELRRTGSSAITATVVYNMARPEVPSQPSGSATTTLSIDYAARTLMAQWTIDGQDFLLQGDYRPDHNTRLTGTVRSIDGRYSGTFAGDFYGPGAKVFGIVFSAQGDGRGMAGRVIGQAP
ncbi:hypothetical protein [Novosphingobium kaempferiae]|uniref:hypothetical protein n=1 Tax=Novosphingobium kaempferiae TaxID=2896849 RepID=UPI001E31B450|nr:hypothetical protein [Novosphingobium kaempferiae]